MPEPTNQTPATPDPAPSPAPAAVESSPSPNPAPTEGAEKQVRPEGLGEAFNAYWSDDKGLDLAKLQEDFTGLTAAKAEADSRAARVPEKPEEYEVGLPEGFKLPDGFEFQVDPDDPMLPIAREFAHKHGLSKDDFKEMIALKAQLDTAEHNEVVKGIDAELQKLGTKGRARVEAIQTFLGAKLGDDLAGSLMPSLVTAKQVEAFEKMMDLMKGAAPKFSAAGREMGQVPEISDEAWNKMSPSDRINWSRTHSKPRAA